MTATTNASTTKTQQATGNGTTTTAPATQEKQAQTKFKTKCSHNYYIHIPKQLPNIPFRNGEEIFLHVNSAQVYLSTEATGTEKFFRTKYRDNYVHVPFKAREHLPFTAKDPLFVEVQQNKVLLEKQ